MKSNFIKIFLAIFFALLLLLGIFLMVAPAVERNKRDTEIQHALSGWKESYQPKTENATVDQEETKETEPLYPELLAAMIAYNQKIYTEGQTKLVDAWSYQKTSFDLTTYGIEDNVAGYISIPAIDVEMPLYLGASYDNLAKGFAQLSETSMPIGGINTNCVVACHRGYNGSAFLRDADQLEVGDIVTLQNLWEPLTYKVCDIITIQPHEVSKVLIQPGRDLLTIVTCTPYGVGSHRLIIFCEREEQTERTLTITSVVPKT